jgi:hypothetical protein
MKCIYSVRKQNTFSRGHALLVLALFLTSSLAHAAAPAPTLLLKKGDRVAVVGDSITEQRLYSKFIETYLTVCVPQLETKSFQFGWSGERASGLADRMDNDLVLTGWTTISSHGSPRL